MLSKEKVCLQSSQWECGLPSLTLRYLLSKESRASWKSAHTATIFANQDAIAICCVVANMDEPQVVTKTVRETRSKVTLFFAYTQVARWIA